MIYKPYDVYHAFKTIENEVKGKNTKILSEDKYDCRLSDDNKDLLQQIADRFNTRYSNIGMDEFIRCGFHHFKGFSYDKFFRDIVLTEYIRRDSRKKRKSTDSMIDIRNSMEYINRDLSEYIKEHDGTHKTILADYISNNVCSTVIFYVIWRGIWVPEGVEWEYMNVIQNNKEDFVRSVVKFAPMLDKWRQDMRDRRMKEIEDEGKELLAGTTPTKNTNINDSLIYGNGKTLGEKKKEQGEDIKNRIDE